MYGITLKRSVIPVSAFQVLQECLQPEVPPSLQQKVVHALLETRQTKQAGAFANLWQTTCLAALAPASARSIQTWCTTPDELSMTSEQLMVSAATSLAYYL